MTTWQNPQYFPRLENNQVHIWRASLDLTPPEIQHLELLLSPDEIARAKRFRFAHHQRRFIVARGILRQLLGTYCQTNPQNLIFSYGEQGKPLLTALTAQVKPDLSLQFNISHSQEYALFGFTLNHLIGVDLECHRPMPDALKIAQRFFSPRESKLLQETATEKQSQLFFRFWTAKEAYLKAIGKGLADSLSSVELAFDSTGSIYLAALEGNPKAINNWALFSCTPSANYGGAIAINARVSSESVNYWCWHSDLFPKI